MIGAAEIRRIMEGKSNIIRVDEGAFIADAAQMMEEHGVGCLVVVRKGRKIVGILSERDVLVKVVAKRLPPNDTRVCDVMSKKLVYCSRETPIAKAQQLMAQHEIRHLPIIEKGVVVGMISSRDILAHQLSSVEAIVRSQSKVLQRLERTFTGITELAKGKSQPLSV